MLSGNSTEYSDLKEHFLKTGRGRRPDLPTLERPTQKVLLVLFCLRDDSNSSWDVVLAWFQKLFPGIEVSRGRLEHRIEAIWKATKNGPMTRADLDIVVDFAALPEPLGQLGFARERLLKDNFSCDMPVSVDSLSNEVLAAVNAFRSKERLPNAFTYKFFLSFYPNYKESQMRCKVTASLKKIKALKSSKKAEVLKNFLKEPFIVHVSLTSDSEAAQSRPDGKDTVPDSSEISRAKQPIANSSKQHQDMSQTQAEMTKMKTSITALKQKIEDLELQVTILKEERQSLREENDHFQHTARQLEEKNELSKKLRKENEALNESMKKFKESTAYKNNTQLRKDLSAAKTTLCEKEDEIKDLASRLQSMQSSVDCLKAQVKSEQTMKSKLKKNLEAERTKTDSLHYSLEVGALDDTTGIKEKPKTREERFNKFNEPIRKTYMALQGEANVAATNCSKVVQIVCNTLFDLDVALKDLPSTSSALNMMYEGNVIAKHQVVDEINKSDHFTYASDGTSRQKVHYMERHLVLDTGKAVSMGYTKISSDDANTLLDQTIEAFEELTDSYGSDQAMGEEEKEEQLKDIIRKMKCVMSDRAANMKLFNKKLSEWKQHFVGEDLTTHFLYCNAHFLIGLATATDAVISSEEARIKDDLGHALGRDAEGAKFSRFAGCKENSACRIIRLASDVLGPRGDEKSGCREEWLVFCGMNNIQSKFSSFRTNRFNNLFENAQATLFHRQHILDFLAKHSSASNLKLQSISSDLKDKEVMSMVAAIALLNLAVTGPYWQLMNSTLPYGSFPGYVRKLEKAFDKFCHQEIPLTELTSVFEDFAIQDDYTKVFLGSEDCSSETALSTFKALSLKYSEVLKRQLNDFLDGGVFGEEIDPDVQKVLDTCPLTNLIGEQMFGDLDYDMHKRKRASLHLRSTLNMWKKNATAKWLDKQGADKQKKLMGAAMKNAGTLKQKSKEAEHHVKERIQEKLLENERTRNKKDLKEKQTKADILEAIIAHGGVCKSKQDLDNLLQHGNAESFKAQIRYRKVFLGEKQLRVTGKVGELYKSLLASINEDNVESSRESASESEYSETGTDTECSDGEIN